MTASPTLFCDLLHRQNDGIEVTLLWNIRPRKLSVFVCDTRANETFEIRVDPDEALDVFEHPWAYVERQARGVPRMSRPGHSIP